MECTGTSKGPFVHTSVAAPVLAVAQSLASGTDTGWPAEHKLCIFSAPFYNKFSDS